MTWCTTTSGSATGFLSRYNLSFSIMHNYIYTELCITCIIQPESFVRRRVISCKSHDDFSVRQSYTQNLNDGGMERAQLTW